MRLLDALGNADGSRLNNLVWFALPSTIMDLTRAFSEEDDFPGSKQ